MDGDEVTSGDRVLATTLPDPEHDRPARAVTGRLLVRHVPTLGYDQYTVGGEHVDPASVRPADADPGGES